MITWLAIDDPQGLAALPLKGAIAPLSADDLRLHAPDLHWVGLLDGAIVARCSLWWRQVPPWPSRQLGVIGHYAAHADWGVALLQQALATLATQGCTLAVGPMDGNTWRRYRLVSDSPSGAQGVAPPFFLEPQNPLVWNQHFGEAGFYPLASYSSALNPDLSQRDPRLARIAQRLAAAGIEVRSLHLPQFEAELHRIHTLSCESFQHNFLYTPIEAEEFFTQYSAVKPYLNPKFVLLAEQRQPDAPPVSHPESANHPESTLVGFLFAIPDLLQAQRQEAIDTIIVKTVAVLPGRAYAGLGSLLVDQVQAIAHSLGYTRAIHALMHDQNSSRNISHRFAYPIRQYTLYAADLEK